MYERNPLTENEIIQAHVDLDLKREAEEIFAELGLSATEAITLFYKQVILYQGLPFGTSVPNAATVKAIREAGIAVNLTEYGGIDGLKAEFD